MTLTIERAVAYIDHFYRTIMSRYGPYVGNLDLVDFGIRSSVLVLEEHVANGHSILAALETQVHGMVGHLGMISGRLNVTQRDMDRVFDGELIADKIEVAPLIDLLYPNASSTTRSILLEAIHNRNITNTGLTIGILDQTRGSPTPSAEAIIDSVLEIVGGTAPTVDFYYPGLSTAQTDFIATIYVGVFGRAPENEGLKWWSFEMKNFLDAGMNHDQALREVAKYMYHSGTVAGEGGTDMSNADFVSWTYQNSLGRPADSGGHSYWTEMLDRGVETRDAFAVSFLGSALGAQGDGDYLEARVAVAKWVAQEHVTSPGATWPDLVAVLRDVTSPAEAFRTIGSLEAVYGRAPGGQPLTGILDWSDGEAVAHWAGLAASYGSGEGEDMGVQVAALAGIPAADDFAPV